MAEKILQSVKRENDDIYFDAELDAFVIRFDECEEEETEYYMGEDIMVDGESYHVYDIGSFSWRWDEYEENEDEVK